MKKQPHDLYDFIERPPIHKPGKYWNKVAYVILFLWTAFCFSLIYASSISAQAITRQDAIRNAQIRSGVPQFTYKVVTKN